MQIESPLGLLLILPVLPADGSPQPAGDRHRGCALHGHPSEVCSPLLPQVRAPTECLLGDKWPLGSFTRLSSSHKLRKAAYYHGMASLSLVTFVFFLAGCHVLNLLISSGQRPHSNFTCLVVFILLK